MVRELTLSKLTAVLTGMSAWRESQDWLITHLKSVVEQEIFTA